LPDGTYICIPKIPIFVYILEGLAIKILVCFAAIRGYFVAFLVNVMGVWYFLLTFGVFFHFGLLHQGKSGNPA
jgi:hypothetical protein